MRVLIVGLGSIGQRHVRNLRRLLPEGFEGIAYRARGAAGVLNDRGEFDPTQDPAEYYALRSFQSLDEALSQDPDITIVSNPTRSHVPVALRAAEHRSHILIEKPLSDNAAGVEELTRTVELYGLVAAVAYQYRFHPALNTVRRWLTEGRIGRIAWAHLVNGEFMPGWHPWEDYRSTYAARSDLGGGAIATQSHEFDYAQWLFGPPRRVYAVGGHLSVLDVNVEDVVAVTMECGTPGRMFPVIVSLDYLQSPPRKQLVVIGEEGKIQCDLLECSASLTIRGTAEPTYEEHPDYDRNQMHMAILKTFLDAIAGRRQPIVDLYDAKVSLSVILAAKQSLHVGQPVSVNLS